MTEDLTGHLKIGRWPESCYPAYLPPEIHRQPIYALGLSGSGKSTLLGNLALQWSRLGEGVLLIDVKDGQLARDVASRAEAAKLIYVAPGTCVFANHRQHWGLNILELPARDGQTIEQVVGNIMSMVERLDRADYTQMTLLRTQLDSAVRLVLYEPEPDLIKVRRALTEQAYRRELIARHRQKLNPEVVEHFDRFDDSKQNSGYGRAQQITSTVNCLKELITPDRLRYMLAQPASTITLGKWLEAGKLVVVDCVSRPPGQPPMSNRNAELLGNLILTQAMHFTFTRVVTAESRYVRLVCDEFDLLAGNNFARLITEARSYKVLPVMAHQNKDQLRADRDKAQTLYNAASGVPVESDFTLTDEDRHRMRQLRSDSYTADEDDVPLFHAKLRLRNRGLPGLIEAGQAALIELLPWWEPEVDGQLERAIGAQADPVFTRPERLLRAAQQTARAAAGKGEHEPATSRTGRPTKQTAARAALLRRGPDGGTATALGDDPGGLPGPLRPGPLPGADQLAARQAPVFGPSVLDWQPPRRGGGQKRGEPDVSAAPEGSRVRDGAAGL